MCEVLILFAAGRFKLVWSRFPPPTIYHKFRRLQKFRPSLETKINNFTFHEKSENNSIVFFSDLSMINKD